MKLYLYDFDGTIYDGDSSVDFFKFCLKKDKRLFKHIFKMLFNWIKYKAKYLTITEFKEIVFSYLTSINNIDDYIQEFWNKNEVKLKKFYLEKNHQNDIIISASPYFLLKPICDKLKVKDLIASDVDKVTGKFNKPNCRGKEKVKVFNKEYPNAIIMEMYSDSYHDKPLLDLAEKSFFVKGNKIYDFKTYKPNVLKRFWNFGWGIYHKNEELWNYLIVGALTTLISIVSYGIFSKAFNIHYLVSTILSWIIAVAFAYFTNRWFVFHSKNKKMFKEAVNFVGSRIFSLILDMGLMFVLVDLLKIEDLIAKIIIQVIITVANYFISKIIVFRKDKKK